MENAASDPNIKPLCGKKVLSMLCDHVDQIDRVVGKDCAMRAAARIHVTMDEAEALKTFYSTYDALVQKLENELASAMAALGRAETQNANQRTTICRYKQEMEDVERRIVTLEKQQQADTAIENDATGAQYIHVGGVTFKVILEHFKK